MSDGLFCFLFLDALDQEYAYYKNPHDGSIATVVRDTFIAQGKPLEIVVVVGGNLEDLNMRPWEGE